MSNINLPAAWSGWKMEYEIGTGSYGTVYAAAFRESDGEVRNAAVKVLKIPGNDEELEYARDKYPGKNSFSAYCTRIAADVLKEIKTVGVLNGHPNIVGYDDCRVEKNDLNGTWTIFIRMPLLTPLDKYLETNVFEEKDAAVLGIDLCNALSFCKKTEIIHRDIKNENVMVDGDGCFKLSDFGIAGNKGRIDSCDEIAGTTVYMAPEVFHSGRSTFASDQYSLGIMLYRLLNRNRDPFIDIRQRLVVGNMRKEALHRRMQGEALPKPVDASEQMSRIILKACAFDAKKRYGAIEELQDDLQMIYHSQIKSFRSS